MAEDSEGQGASMVSQDMIERKGVWGDSQRSAPIERSEIRRWAIAVYWPEAPPRIFWDEEYAATTRWGGIVAPQDFNPFTWPVQPRGDYRPPAVAGGGGRNMMNGGQTDTYGVPMRPGDVISARSRLRNWEERTTRLGRTLFSFNESEWTNQDGAVVKTRV